MPYNFYIRSTKFFLTYPQCDVRPTILQQLFRERFADDSTDQQYRVNLQRIIVCSEQHANGDPHLHAYIEFSAPFKITSSTVWDLLETEGSRILFREDTSRIQTRGTESQEHDDGAGNGRNGGKVWHPNLQSARSPKRVRAYIQKGGNYVEWPQGGHSSDKQTYKDLLEQCSTRAEFLSMFKRVDPRSWVLHNDRVLSYADRYYSDKRQDPYSSPYGVDSFTLPADLLEWYEDEFLKQVTYYLQ